MGIPQHSSSGSTLLPDRAGRFAPCEHQAARALALSIVVCAALAMQTARRRISRSADSPDLGRGAGRHARYPVAQDRRGPDGGLQEADCRRQSRRRRRGHRGRSDGQGGSGWLHDLYDVSPAHGECEPRAESAVPHGRRLHAHHADNRRRARAGRPSVRAGEQHARVHRLDEKFQGAAQFRLRRQWQRWPPGGRTLQDDDRRQGPAHSLQELGGGADRSVRPTTTSTTSPACRRPSHICARDG